MRLYLLFYAMIAAISVIIPGATSYEPADTVTTSMGVGQSQQRECTASQSFECAKLADTCESAASTRVSRQADAHAESASECRPVGIVDAFSGIGEARASSEADHRIERCNAPEPSRSGQECSSESDQKTYDGAHQTESAFAQPVWKEEHADEHSVGVEPAGHLSATWRQGCTRWPVWTAHSIRLERTREEKGTPYYDLS